MKMSREQRIRVVVVITTCLMSFFTPQTATAEEDRGSHPSCRYCGMDRTKFAHSRALIRYDDGTTVGICSLHCAAIDLALNIDKKPATVLVADYNTSQLIEAEKAYWVIGGDEMGVMTRRPKWAFASEVDAQASIAAHGGRPADFSQAIKAAFEDMYEDLEMIRIKRQKMKDKKDS